MLCCVCVYVCVGNVEVVDKVFHAVAAVRDQEHQNYMSTIQQKRSVVDEDLKEKEDLVNITLLTHPAPPYEP